MSRIAIIGSSPLLLIEAIFRSSQGHQVTIFEKDGDLGGAWKNISLFEGTSEIGSHIFYQNRRAKRFLNDILGVYVDDISPSPKFYSPETKRLYPDALWAVHLSRSERYLNMLGSRGVHALERASISFAKFAFRFGQNLLGREGGHFYTPTGCIGLLGALKGKIESRGIEQRLNTKVQKVHCTPHGALLSLPSASETVMFDHVVTTYGCVAPLLIEGEDADEVKSHNTCHIYFVLERKILDWSFKSFGIPTFAQVTAVQELPYSTFVIRSSVMDPYSQGWRHMKGSVICASIAMSSPHLKDVSEDEIEAHTFNELKKLNVLKETDRFLDSELIYYQRYYRSAERVKKLRDESFNRLTLLDAGNFSQSIAQNETRWLEMSKQAA